jgi:hypothetical protein
MYKLEPIAIELDVEEVKVQLRTAGLNETRKLLAAAMPLISAKAVYEICPVEEKRAEAVIIRGTSFRSKVLSRNLEKAERVFPWVVTIGRGLEARADACTALLERYYLDTIGNMALVKARDSLRDHLRSRFALDGLSHMSPGSLQDWPIEAQRPLFSILGDVTAQIHVALDENLIMNPRKSLSGIYFPTEITFHSCQLCPREDCRSRKAPYSEAMARSYGVHKPS